MKIKEIYISSFGGVKDLKISAENGLNVIYGENEKGKTTLMSFIKMMFYGSERANQLLSKNIRKKYTPWDGSPMAGSIVFEARGRNFRLDREFRSSNSTDKVTLWDLDLGESKSVSGDVGNEIFGLSVGAFERTVFIGQFGFPESDAKSESEINSRLSNIALTGDESVSFETVKNRILKPKTALMSKSGNAGIYDKNMKCISDLETRLTKATEINETYRQNKEQLNLANAEILKMQKEADELKAKISAEQDIRNTEKLKKLLELKEELDDLNKTLLLDDGTLADEGYLRKLQLCLSLVSPIKEKLDSKVNEEKALKNSIEVFEGSSPEEKENQKKELEEKIAELEKVKSELKNAVDNKKREEKDIMFSLADTSAFKQKFNKPFLFVAVASLIAALGSVFASFIIAAVFGVVALVFFALAFAMRPIDKEQIENMRKKAADIQQEISELEQSANKTGEDLSSLKIKIETVNNAIGSNLEAIRNQKEKLLNLQSEILELKGQFEPKWQEFLSLYSKYKKDTVLENLTDALEEIRTGALKQKEIKSQINYILRDVGNISYEEAKKKIEDSANISDENIDFDAIKREYDQLMEQITNGKTKLAGMSANIQSAVAAAENPEILKQKIKELKEETQNQRSFCEAANMALEVLEQSFIEVRRSYGSELEKNSAKIFSQLTDGKYGNMSISKSLDISAEEEGKFGTREIGYLSSGTADQAYLSMRLSLAELMADGEKLPLFLDDSLAQYDDKRLKKTLEYLNEYLNEGQGLLFTCHGAVAEKGKNAGAKVIEL